MPTIIILANMIKININPKDKHRFPHVHIIHAEKEALMRISDQEILENNGFSKATLKEVAKVVEARKEELINAWSEYNG